MHALQWTTTETDPMPAPAPSPQGPRTTADERLWNGAPGGSVRHVLRAIASEPACLGSPRRWRERVRPLVDQEQARLRARFETDGLVEAFQRGRTHLADGAVIGLLHLARAENPDIRPPSVIAPLTVLALGGYGRRELAPGSDLDVLFLLASSSGERIHAERLIGFVLAGLWDLGFEVGHAARTLGECRDLAGSEPTVLASLLDARLLTGCFTLYGVLDAELKRIAGTGWAEACAGVIAAELSAPAMPCPADEPDVKRGRGGLRDIQRLLWLAKMRHVTSRADWPTRSTGGALELPPAITQARHFLWQVRAHLHLVAGRAEDRLRRRLQPVVASRLGLGRGEAGADALLRAYRQHTRSVCALLRAQPNRVARAA